MKKYLTILFLLIGSTVFSQEREYRTLLDNQDLRISGMGGPFMQFTSVAGEFGFMMGGGAAVLLDDFFFVHGSRSFWSFNSKRLSSPINARAARVNAGGSVTVMNECNHYGYMLQM